MPKIKSQAALEFLTTYGWAFLVILIVIGALSYFGILSPAKFLPNRCNFGSEISCIDHSIGTNGVALKLRNNAGESIILDSVSVSSESNSISCTSSSLPVWKAGEIKDLSVSCDFSNSGIVQGEKGKLNLNLVYYPVLSGSKYNKSISGEVFSMAQSFSVLPISCLDILNKGASVGNGVYTIAPSSTSISVYCDMASDGGGWTLVATINGANRNHVSANSVGTTPMPGTYVGSKLSDTIINQLITYRYRFDCRGGIAFIDKITFSGDTNTYCSSNINFAHTWNGAWVNTGFCGGGGSYDTGLSSWPNVDNAGRATQYNADFTNGCYASGYGFNGELWVK